jgi:hypothetical protein
MRTTRRTAHTSATIIFFGVITGYCNNGECPAREGEIHVTELVRPITTELRCPACRRLLTLTRVGGWGARMRVLDTLTAARQARIAIERLLALNDWPEDRALSLAIDRLLLLEEQAAAAVGARLPGGEAHE